MVGKFALVGKVEIEQVDDRTVTFATRSASRSGDRDECLRRAFTCPVSEVWAHPIAGAPAPVAMRPGAVGNLFLTSAGLEAKSHDGFQIYGFGTPLLPIKYPDNAAGAQLLGDLTVIPSSIVVHGTLRGGTRFHDIELLGPDAADAQHIAWNGADFLKLHLTARGAKHLHLAERAATVEVWPTAITVTGAPASDPAVSGSVDILDSEKAGLEQQLHFARHRDPVRLSLTHDGFARFHVMPGQPDAAPAPHRISHRR